MSADLNLPASVYKYIDANATKEGFAYIRSGESGYLFFEPVLRVRADITGSYCETSEGTETFSDVWHALEKKLLPYAQGKESDYPCMAGFLSYELGQFIEEIKGTETNFPDLPLYDFYLYKKTLEISEDKEIWHELPIDKKVFWEVEAGRNDLNLLPVQNMPASLAEIEEEFSAFSNFSKEKYLDAVEKIILYIRKGKAYQVNLSQQFNLPYELRAYDLFYALSEFSPAAYSAFYNSDGNFIISSSPENFLKYKGGKLSTSPIKGTKLRESVDNSDTEPLKNSPKNLSELTMIVDIERNDLSKVSIPGTVTVEKHARVESMEQVHHLVSDISCRLKEEVKLLDVIKAMFPSGSISGAPKISAMNIISELEKTARGAYTGSIGWLSLSGNFEFNVAIRTALVSKGRAYYSAGGGIVFDSVPEDEYYETLAKTKGFYLAYKAVVADK
jgi:para-aminobenzoate synthetase component 1